MQKYFYFFLTFLVKQENDLTRKLRLILEFMISSTGKQTIVLHIFPNFLRNKSNQTIKFGQLREYNLGNCFLTSETSSRSLLVFQKNYIWCKSVCSTPQFQIFWQSSIWIYKPTVNLFRKGTRISLFTTFTRKINLIIYSIN